MRTAFTKSIYILFFLLLTSSALIAQTYWGTNPGEGDFDGGLNGWTVESIQNDSTWVWDQTGLMTGGVLGGQGESINSPTASNGVMIINADYNTTNPTNSLPPGPWPFYITDLVSPVIDLSMVPIETRININFYQLFRFFGAETGYTFSSYAYSTDGGATWSDRIDANPTLPQTTGGNGVPSTNGAATLRVPFEGGLAGSDNVKIKFTFAGNFYFWGIDDITISKRPDNDVKISELWRATAPYASIPLSQIEPMSFLANIENIGSNTATGVELAIDVTTGGNSVYNSSIPYGDLVADSLAENEIFGSFTALEKGLHIGTYTLTIAETDSNLGDNTFSFELMVTDSTFSKENEATGTIQPGDTNWEPAEPKSWTYGNHFYINNGADYLANTASIIVDGDSISDGLSLTVKLWKWNPPLDDWAADPVNAQYDCLPDDREQVGFGEYTIQATDEIDQVKVIQLTDLNTLASGVQLDDNTHYVLMVEYVDTGAGNVVRLGSNDAIDYDPAIYVSRLNNAPRMSNMLAIDVDLEDQAFNDAGFIGQAVPCVRLNVINKNILENTVETLDDAKLNIYPSPANEDMMVNIKLSKPYAEATIKVIDVSGNIIMEKQYDHLHSERLLLNVANYPNGSYFFQVSTSEGVKTKNFIVQHK